MMIKLDFGEMLLEADIFDSLIANKFMENLPYSIELTKWGNELYGSIGVDLGEENPIMDTEKTHKQIMAHVTKNVPWGLKVEMKNVQNCNPVWINTDNRGLQISKAVTHNMEFSSLSAGMTG